MDIKPSNFFVKADGTVKLGDFGQAVNLKSHLTPKDEDNEGDCIYMAPELLTYESSRISKAADIFSLGATLLEIAAGINLP